MRQKRNKYKTIIENSIEGVSGGFSHRRHRRTEKKTGKKRNLNFKKQKINKIKEEENWEDYYNIIGTEK